MTRKRFLRLLMSTGMQRSKAQYLADFIHSHGDTYNAGLQYLTAMILAERWVSQAIYRCNGQLVRHGRQLCIVRMEQGQQRLLSVLPPEIELHIPPHPLLVHWGRGNGKTEVYRTVHINLIALKILAQIKYGGTN